MTLDAMFDSWSDADREDLGKLLDLTECRTGSQLERATWELFNGVFGSMSRFARRINEDLGEPSRPEPPLIRQPDYRQALEMACKQLKCFEKEASVEELETFFVEGLMIACLSKAKPRKRSEILSALDVLSQEAHRAAKPMNYGGEAVFTAARVAAGASGFGVYLYAATLLGALTEAVGITLPFAIYTTLSSTIALLIGPVGLAITVIPVVVKLGAPNWKKLLTVMLFIVQVRRRPNGEQSA